MAETPQDIVNRELREFKRYTGDGLPGEPVNAPLPVGDPQSGTHNPKKANLRKAMLETLEGAEAQGDRAEAEADHSEEWAQSDDPISVDAGGDGATDRSSKWHADRSETAQGLSEDARDDALDYSNDALSSKTQAELAALAAGAPLFTSEPDLGTAPSPYLLQVEAGTQVYTHDGSTATMVGWLGKVEFPTVAALLAFAGPLGPVGTELWADTNKYRKADPSATDHHMTIASGEKLYVRPMQDGSLAIEALGLDNTGTTNLTDVINKLAAAFPVLVFPAGTFFFELTTSTVLSIVGAGKDQTVFTSETLTSGTTITVGADLTYSDLTIKCHPTSASAKTINHDGSHTVTARNARLSGCNHYLSAGLDSAADYHDCEVISGPMPAAEGAVGYSPLAKFDGCTFLGERALKASDSKFFRCVIGSEDETNSAVHMPSGATNNAGEATGFTGKAEFWDCIIRSGGTGITEGNDAHAVLRRCDVSVAHNGGGSAALYARSKSTFDVEDSDIRSITGTALSFAKTIPQDPNNIGLTGESHIKRSRLEGGFSSLAVPALSDSYPADIGNVILTDVDIIGGDDMISLNNSTYHVFQTEKVGNYSSTAIFTDNDQTQRFRFKQNGQIVGVTGSDGAKTGCHLSHLDAVTGEAHPDGMEITLRYSGVSSRYVTFADGNTDDGGSMRFADGESTLATTQFGSYRFRLFGTGWRQVDG